MNFYNKWFTLVIGKGDIPFGITYNRYGRNEEDNRDKLKINLPYFHLSIRFPWSSMKKETNNYYGDFGCRIYGFEFICDCYTKFPDCLVFRYGRESAKYINFPWYYEWYSTTKYPYEGEPIVEHYKMTHEEHEKIWDDWDNMKDDKKNIVVPYTYIRNNGERQNTFAHIHREVREWRWKWFMWLDCKWIKVIRNEVDVEFQNEIGEGVDDWKGGCISCDYELKPGEHILDALRRMEKERRFD